MEKQIIGGMQTSITVKDGEATIKTTQDFTPIMENAILRQNEGLHGSSEMKHAAKIPKLAIDVYCAKHGIDFREFMTNEVHIRRMCNDPDLSKFRIWPGRV